MAHLRVDSLQSSQIRTTADSRLSAYDVPSPRTPTYSHVSSFRSPQLEVLLYCPFSRTAPPISTTHRPMPAFGVDDVISGKIIIDPSCRAGRVILTVAGTVNYNSTEEEGARKQRHMFFCASNIIHITSSDSSPPRSGFRQVFSVKRRQSRATLDSGESGTRAHPFAFDIGHDRSAGEIIPSTFSSPDTLRMPFEVAYQVTATWEPLKITEQPSVLTIPIAIQPDPDFHSLDGLPQKRNPWIEIPLKTQREVPFRSAVTLPESLTFLRASSIPYFVVFTTTPRSKTLAREIAADATISVSISTQLTITEATTVASTAPGSLMSVVSSESRSSGFPFRVNMLKRIRSKTSIWSSTQSYSSDLPDRAFKPLPALPPRTTFSETQTVYNKIFLGFPKRPRHRSPGQGHPSLDAHRALPDGLHKETIPLSRNMLASFQRNGVSLKYFLDVSVLVGQDELHARIPIRIA
ncbi:hypothetical protein B0H11DRAFT_2182310 [Mycena galericulata]|nr:hypothetical protein B0H11DRAFT_2182310 [Mycena galericulata]